MWKAPGDRERFRQLVSTDPALSGLGRRRRINQRDKPFRRARQVADRVDTLQAPAVRRPGCRLTAILAACPAPMEKARDRLYRERPDSKNTTELNPSR